MSTSPPFAEADTTRQPHTRHRLTGKPSSRPSPTPPDSTRLPRPSSNARWASSCTTPEPSTPHYTPPCAAWVPSRRSRRAAPGATPTKCSPTPPPTPTVPSPSIPARCNSSSTPIRPTSPKLRRAPALEDTNSWATPPTTSPPKTTVPSTTSRASSTARSPPPTPTSTPARSSTLSEPPTRASPSRTSGTHKGRHRSSWTTPQRRASSPDQRSSAAPKPSTGDTSGSMNNTAEASSPSPGCPGSTTSPTSSRRTTPQRITAPCGKSCYLRTILTIRKGV
mmetsp:Transcript_27233/g.68304  ORF Transcript_27233/g.68304 Transcript_27233/m.68304 type:complete len:279 (-) Transcript_27233:217-1053(-)